MCVRELLLFSPTCIPPGVIRTCREQAREVELSAGSSQALLIKGQPDSSTPSPLVTLETKKASNGIRSL